ncbi:hypothetical protein F0P96_03975 [Hymenobacter busanensis]|uniref:Uncharacterized protein n=1 Tax=Hymenobacter busanensis TaxID=2607656 RepID=A0A7L4ZW78_9BACT|nr:hypothetical protein [Hymenobacter busanensis]KAA9339783.1 hypothetical protein F0P96_03975 [Hymenobacter busanensis]QHJ06462.1 hypothetical protein GUY19_03770 [Hymenobacter busanensis]
MKRFLLAALLGSTALLSAPVALAQRTDSTTVKPQLNTAPPGPVLPRPRTTPAPATPTNPAPATAPTQAPIQPTTPPKPSTTLDDDGRSAQPLPGSAAPQAQPARPRTTPTIDDDGRPAERIPSTGQIPGSQAVDRPKSKYFVYGNFSLGLNGNNAGGTSYNVGASPALGYRITDRIAAGPGIVYSHSGYSIPAANSGTGIRQSISGNNYGLKAFAQVMVIKNFFVHAEYEVTRAQIIYEVLTSPTTLAVRRDEATVRTPLLGIGYRQELGDRAAADIAVLYNFNDGLQANIYGQPVIRFSFLFDIGK